MPIYELECTACGTKNDVIIGLSEFEEVQKNNKKDILNLSSLKLVCSKCNKSLFRKHITAHGKTAYNWSAWQRKP